MNIVFPVVWQKNWYDSSFEQSGMAVLSVRLPEFLTISSLSYGVRPQLFSPFEIGILGIPFPPVLTS